LLKSQRRQFILAKISAQTALHSGRPWCCNPGRRGRRSRHQLLVGV